MNRWNIPDCLEKEIIQRDKKCVYCGIEFSGSTSSMKNKSTWEHIVNDAKIVSRENIARCCFSCNASKGSKTLAEWFNSAYCIDKNINEDTVAEVVKKAIVSPPTRTDATT